MEKKKGNVYLVGAGCGGADLITVKGLALLRRCDVVLYDSLAAKELLDQVPPACEKINVGKRYAGKAMPQEEINRLLVEKANEGKDVVRLKGGDPYVFGRGGEEMLVLQEEGIPCEEIPGITSAIAAPASAGIPVTHRQCSRMVTILTASSISGQGKQESLTPVDYKALAALQGTLVVLMGMHHLRDLAGRLMDAGKNGDTPAAVIMDGATDRQRSVRATLATLADAVEEAGLKPPAVIVIGEVAALCLTRTFMPGPPGNTMHESSRVEWPSRLWKRSFHSSRETQGSLSGLRIAVTGTEGFSSRLAEKLKKQGAQVIDCSFLRAVPTQESLPELKGYSWLCFTSPNGVDHFFHKMREEKRDLRTLMGMRMAVIGPGTKSRLADYGFYADLMPLVYDADHLGMELAGSTEKTDNILLCRAKKGSPSLPGRLEQAGIPYTDFPLYELEADREKRREAVTNAMEADYLLFGSASGVDTFWEGLLEEKAELPAHVRLACIGEQCAAKLREIQKRNSLSGDIVVAEEFTTEGLIRCVADRANGRQCSGSEA